MLHTLLREMVARGHTVAVIAQHVMESYDFEGIPVHAGAEAALFGTAAELYATTDIVITHLDVTGIVMDLAREFDKPLVHLVHNPGQLKYWEVKPEDAALVIFNANATRTDSKWPGESIVIPPPVHAEDYRTETTREFITLVNLGRNKGGELFWQLATHMPGERFLGVKGAYDLQVPHPRLRPWGTGYPAGSVGPVFMPERPTNGPPPNTVIIDQTPNIRDDVYARTKILIVPSASETWGRVAVEAAASGIPVLCNETPGLREAMADGAMYVPELTAPHWAAALHKAMQPDVYEYLSARALARSRELDPKPGFDLFELELEHARETA